VLNHFFFKIVGVVKKKKKRFKSYPKKKQNISNSHLNVGFSFIFNMGEDTKK